MRKYVYVIGFVGLLMVTLLVTSCAPDYQENFKEEMLTVPDAGLSPILFEIEGGEKAVDVKTNVTEWKVISNADWCAVAKQEGKVTVSATTNDLFVTRVALVTISYGHYSYDIPVSQKGKTSELLIEGKRKGFMKSIDASKQEISVAVSTNMSIDNVNIPDTAAWVQLKDNVINPENANERILTFNVEMSTSSNLRYSTIVLQSSQNYAYTASFVVVQKALEFEMLPLTAEMLSSNAQEPKEGPIKNLLDGDSGSFFHSAWSFSIDEAHNIQVALNEPINNFKFWYKNRNNSNGKPIDVTLTVSLDGETWTEVGHITSGLPTGSGSEYESELFLVPDTFKYLRFTVNKTNSGTAPTFFNMAEFKMYKMK